MASTTRTETVTPAVIHIVSPVGAPAAQDSATGSELHKQVSWEEGTLDNEDLGRRSSKVCCIYHKPRAFAESSSEESSSSSDSDNDEGAKEAGRQRKACKSKHRVEGQDGQKHCCRGPPDAGQAPAGQAPDQPPANHDDQ